MLRKKRQRKSRERKHYRRRKRRRKRKRKEKEEKEKQERMKRRQEELENLKKLEAEKKELETKKLGLEQGILELEKKKLEIERGIFTAPAPTTTQQHEPRRNRIKEHPTHPSRGKEHHNGNLASKKQSKKVSQLSQKWTKIHAVNAESRAIAVRQNPKRQHMRCSCRKKAQDTYSEKQQNGEPCPTKKSRGKQGTPSLQIVREKSPENMDI